MTEMKTIRFGENGEVFEIVDEKARNKADDLIKVSDVAVGEDTDLVIGDSDSEIEIVTPSDLDVINNRINTIIANNNDTDGNSELVDIRVGEDGTTYQSAGAAVRGQIGELKEDLEALATDTSQVSDPIFYSDLIDSASGTATSDNRFKRYYPYHIEAGRIYRMRLRVHAFTQYANASFAMNVRTTNTDNVTSVADIIDEISGNYPKGSVSAGDEFEWYFKAEHDAEYVYVVFGAKSGTAALFTFYVDAPSMSRDVRYAQKFDMAVTALTDPNGNYRVSSFAQYAFKTGHRYRLTVFAENVTLRNEPTSSAYLTVRTTLTDGVSTVSDTTIVDVPGTRYHDAEQYNGDFSTAFEWVSSGNANYLQFYLMSSTPASGMFVIEEINSGVHAYSGENIKLNRPTYAIDKLVTTPKPSGVTTAFQGHAIYKDTLVRLYNTGIAAFYKLRKYGWESVTASGKCNLGSYGSGQHANLCNFSNIFYRGNPDFPLLYVTGGNKGEDMICNVENITVNNGTYSSACVQTITLDQTEFESYGYEKYWGWSAWLIADNALYYFGCKYSTGGGYREFDGRNKYIITRFDIPDPSAGDVTLRAADVKEQWTSAYDVEFTQGGTIYGDYLFYIFGNPANGFPTIIKAFSLSRKTCVAKIDLTGTVLGTIEPEDLYVHNGKLTIGTNTTVMYTLAFDS